MNLFKALFGSSFFQQEMKRNQQYRDNYACCDDIDLSTKGRGNRRDDKSAIQDREKRNKSGK